MRVPFLLFLIFTFYHSISKDSLNPKRIFQDTLSLKSTNKLVVDTQEIPLIDTSRQSQNIYIISEKKDDFLKTVLPVISLILGIFLKIFLDLILDYFKDRKRIGKSGKLWKAELICLENPIDIQIESLKAHKIQIESSNEEIPKLEYSSALNCENFAALSKPDLLDYFRKKEKRDYVQSSKLLNNITVLVTNIKDLNDSLKDKFKSFLDDTSSGYAELSINLGRQQKAYLKFTTDFEIRENKTQLELDSFNAINELYDTYIIPHIEDGKFSIKTLSEEFYEQYIPILGHNRLNPLFADLTDIAFDAMTSIKKINMQKTYWLTNIDILSKLYLENKEFLQKLKQDLEKVKCA